MLGGGGFTGGVYEIGALRALDLLAVNSTVNDFDVYVGTSAGSFVAGMLANGVTPDEMMQVINKRVPSELEDLDLGKVLRPNYLGFLQKAAMLPLRTAELARNLVRMGEFSAIDIGVGLAEALPTGFYSGSGISDYVERSLADADGTNDFRLLEKELYLTATDLDTCERIVFGEEGWADVPISKAVECSTTLPIVYKPVDLKGRQLIDGGIRSTTNVDIAVEKGAKFIVVVNPLVPFVNDFEKTIPTVFGTRVRRVSDMGLPAIANQTFRLIAHARLHQAVEQWRRELPGRRHHPDRARAQRRADVRHADHGLLAAPADRPPRLRVGHRHAGPGLRPLQGDRRAPRPRDLRAPRPPRGRAGRRRGARADLGLAARAGADDLDPAAPVRRGLLAPPTGTAGCLRESCSSSSLSLLSFERRAVALQPPSSRRAARSPARACWRRPRA